MSGFPFHTNGGTILTPFIASLIFFRSFCLLRVFFLAARADLRRVSLLSELEVVELSEELSSDVDESPEIEESDEQAFNSKLALCCDVPTLEHTLDVGHLASLRGPNIRRNPCVIYHSPRGLYERALRWDWVALYRLNWDAIELAHDAGLIFRYRRATSALPQRSRCVTPVSSPRVHQHRSRLDCAGGPCTFLVTHADYHREMTSEPSVKKKWSPSGSDV
ncbi:hypothetical protein K438DRAFT_2028859 [Mycena galopus ATCC 62051]|nr:hypothetical protein K438DRAFT_2028859 [Mycena galopus ATCC 62051]